MTKRNSVRPESGGKPNPPMGRSRKGSKKADTDRWCQEQGQGMRNRRWSWTKGLPTM